MNYKYKTEICKYWEYGKCRFMEESNLCNYAHGENDKINKNKNKNNLKINSKKANEIRISDLNSGEHYESPLNLISNKEENGKTIIIYSLPNSPLSIKLIIDD